MNKMPSRIVRVKCPRFIWPADSNREVISPNAISIKKNPVPDLMCTSCSP